MEDTITIEQLTDAAPRALETIKQLAQQIGNNYKELTSEDLHEMIASPNTTLLVAKAGENIVGMITLLVYRIPYVKKAYLDDLVVDKAQRGRGIAKQLMNHAVHLAKEKGASYIDLTARPKRTEGNNLYESFGFQKRDTNVFRLAFNYDEV